MVIMTKDFVTERLKLKDLYPERAEVLSKEHDIDIEDLELVRKGIVAEKAEVDKDERAVTNYINTGKQDRDNEIIEPEGAILTHYRKNPVVPYGHDYRGLPVAKNIWIKKDKKGLLAKTVFLKHSLADDVYRLYSEDVAGTGPAMSGWSIGFIPLKWEEPEVKDSKPKEGEQDTRLRRRYKEWELMEYSAVMIPSNREALTEMVEKGLIKSEKLKEEIAECVGDECTIKEVMTKPEETDNFIRIPVRDCKVTATITISEKQGITALYCGKIKKIRTYIFDKRDPYNWTMAKAKKWVEEYGKIIQNDIDTHDWVGEHFEAGKSYVDEITDHFDLLDEQQKAKYNCECIKCSHKLTSDKHCKDLKCPKCGGQMRRVERPGPGQESGEVIELDEDVELKIQLDGAVIKLKNPLNPSDKSKLEKAWKELYESEPTYENVTEFCKKWNVEVDVLKEKKITNKIELKKRTIEGMAEYFGEKMLELTDEIKSLKEGRVLSEKNRKQIQTCIDDMTKAVESLSKLMQATEPPAKAEEVDLDLIKESPKQTDKKVNLNEQNIQDIVRNVFQAHLAKMVEEQEKTRKMINKAKGKVE